MLDILVTLCLLLSLLVQVNKKDAEMATQSHTMALHNAELANLRQEHEELQADVCYTTPAFFQHHMCIPAAAFADVQHLQQTSYTKLGQFQI